MKSNIHLGRVFGIKVGLHYSWFLIALLIVLSLSADFRTRLPQWDAPMPFVLAAVTALLFFASLLLHELSHSLVARSQGLRVREITLFALGGVSQIEDESATAKNEFWMAFVGPLTSALLGLVCWSIGFLAGRNPGSPMTVMLSWLGFINFGLAVFNMVPAYPLDGGRILRAILWWKTGERDQATRAAARAGQVLATLFVVVGILEYFGGAGLGGLWISFVGWFLLIAAGDSYRQIDVRKAADSVRVGDVMSHECDVVNSRSTVQDLVDHELLRTGRRCFMVLDDGRISGLITPHEIKQIERSSWPSTPVGAIMRPIAQVQTANPDQPLSSALDTMSRGNFNQLPVVSNGHLEGILSRGHIVNFLQTRADLPV